MTDIFSKKKRSEIMSKIRSKETKIEVEVFRGLRKEGIYFQKHYRLKNRRTCSIDVALPRKKKAVFVDGDFWHGYQFEKNKRRLPKKYWVAKIENNILRDRKSRTRLKREGWSILRVWEHEIKKDSEKAIGKIIKFLKES